MNKRIATILVVVGLALLISNLAFNLVNAGWNLVPAAVSALGVLYLRLEEKSD